MDITTIIDKQKQYFASKKTLDYTARMDALKRLRHSILTYQKALEDALMKDLGKTPIEAYMTEIGLTLKEIRYLMRHLRKYMKKRYVKTSLTDFPAKSYISPYPYGTTLIMSPWNYPVFLTLAPLAGALAAGNTAVVKPSDYSHHTSKVLKEVLLHAFKPEYVTCINGGREENQTLLDQPFDYIFFTGSKAVGRIVMEKASRHLTPFSLELGGKSPCIIEKTAHLKVAAQRIAFGKFLNAGQTCVAPDYILIDETVKEAFLEHLKMAIQEAYGSNPLDNERLVKIINQKHFDRLNALLENQNIVFGGTSDPKTLRIAPTVLDSVSEDNKIMEDEIFGPILPILTYTTIDEAYTYINNHPKPLALYLFTSDKTVANETLAHCNFGGGCINDVVVHVASHTLPFGGVGESGMGSYHGKASFDTFTHYRSVIHKANWLDPAFRYPPYTTGKEKIIKRFLK